jgi:hypothetical protein
MALIPIVGVACQSVLAVELAKTPKQALCLECGLTFRLLAAGEPADGQIKRTPSARLWRNRAFRQRCAARWVSSSVETRHWPRCA